jgi:hypothetical protein
MDCKINLGEIESKSHENLERVRGKNKSQVKLKHTHTKTRVIRFIGVRFQRTYVSNEVSLRMGLLQPYCWGSSFSPKVLKAKTPSAKYHEGIRDMKIQLEDDADRSRSYDCRSFGLAL